MSTVHDTMVLGLDAIGQADFTALFSAIHTRTDLLQAAKPSRDLANVAAAVSIAIAKGYPDISILETLSSTLTRERCILTLAEDGALHLAEGVLHEVNGRLLAARYHFELALERKDYLRAEFLVFVRTGLSDIARKQGRCQRALRHNLLAQAVARRRKLKALESGLKISAAWLLASMDRRSEAHALLVEAQSGLTDGRVQLDLASLNGVRARLLQRAGRLHDAMNDHRASCCYYEEVYRNCGVWPRQRMRSQSELARVLWLLGRRDNEKLIEHSRQSSREFQVPADAVRKIVRDPLPQQAFDKWFDAKVRVEKKAGELERRRNQYWSEALHILDSPTQECYRALARVLDIRSCLLTDMGDIARARADAESLWTLGEKYLDPIAQARSQANLANTYLADPNGVNPQDSLDVWQRASSAVRLASTVENVRLQAETQIAFGFACLALSPKDMNGAWAALESARAALAIEMPDDHLTADLLRLEHACQSDSTSADTLVTQLVQLVKKKGPYSAKEEAFRQIVVGYHVHEAGGNCSRVAKELQIGRRSVRKSTPMSAATRF